ncbi:hypothetical protein DPEC_G00184020 [Dallia pectoralis]|uniref:Uncharacterized protein n=1 Tax=Dallia pectoralis TaxID=75939 RepID=A0ACC2GAT8_DALPE|nr:hypothetical protein DPEC_G00184020 [Dallia pectoralis]
MSPNKRPLQRETNLKGTWEGGQLGIRGPQLQAGQRPTHIGTSMLRRTTAVPTPSRSTIAPTSWCVTLGQAHADCALSFGCPWIL